AQHSALARRGSELVRDLRAPVADTCPVRGVVLPRHRVPDSRRKCRLAGAEARAGVEVVELVAVDLAAVVAPVAATPEPRSPREPDAEGETPSPRRLDVPSRVVPGRVVPARAID